ncbi:MAG: sensor histidine kinase [Saprospiraceae bacterium]|nr:sensor histidine kinase [Saprospiraceae bacterium]
MENSLSPTEIILFFGAGILIMIALALVMISYSSRAQRRILTQRMENQAAELRHQQELLQRNLLVQEEERQRIAAQLHDDIGSKLGVLHLAFHRLRRADQTEKSTEPMYEEINALIANALDTTRRISHELLPPTLEDFGLLEALSEFFESVRNTGAVTVQFEHNVLRSDFSDPATELHLFRIVQELTNNSLKYASAHHIAVHLTKDDHHKIHLRYTDDGKGFDQESMVSKGLGFRNLQNRTRMIGAEFQLRTAPGQGFEMNIMMPLPHS